MYLSNTPHVLVSYRMISCDSCGMTVHQLCYGIREMPDVNDKWFCRACELKEEVRNFAFYLHSYVELCLCKL